ncbi:hypothetical protein L6452_09428 [Arctium lappa]|uniref:Uncharacterized protein n=1 Tax=Arctium lappa TaxID=4217 RepID=A0ACB9DKG6_ARCLA|nr:hypothetical protein L6452_09428 [Arctium lappa]
MYVLVYVCLLKPYVLRQIRFLFDIGLMICIYMIDVLTSTIRYFSYARRSKWQCPYIAISITFDSPVSLQ